MFDLDSDLAQMFRELDTQEALLKRSTTTKFPYRLILLELVEELALEQGDFQLTWIRRGLTS